jgi:alanine racemase
MVIDRLRVVVNLDNLVHNFKLLKALNNNQEVMAVVKADAYGHGAIECSKHLEANGCKFFAVTVLKEAIELRNAGIKSPILIFGKTDPLNFEYLEQYDLIQTIDSFDYAEKLNHQTTKKIKVHLNVDTGMSRLGIYCHEESDMENVVKDIVSIKELNKIDLCGIYTHFASSDADLDFTHKQKTIFTKLLSLLANERIDYGLVHLANSSGIVRLDNLENFMARSGIALYGYPPVKTEEKFLPVMELFAKVIAIHQIKENDSVSYGRTFVATKPTKVATVAIGYADGYMRILSNNDYFYYQSHKLPVIGRVCMGLTMVDITGTNIDIGCEVEVFGSNKSLVDMALRAQTITYELLTNMAKPRVDRVYLNKENS